MKENENSRVSIVSSRCSRLTDQLVLNTSSTADVRNPLIPLAYSNDRISEALHDSNQCCLLVCLIPMIELGRKHCLI
jgi:hypothetical protein